MCVSMLAVIHKVLAPTFKFWRLQFHIPTNNVQKKIQGLDKK
jgi:hypothetical protein